jgi:hypothetical protein
MVKEPSKVNSVFTERPHYGISEPKKESGVNCRISKMIFKLREYENTGMTPQDAIKWRNDAIKATAKLGEIRIKFRLDSTEGSEPNG